MTRTARLPHERLTLLSGVVATLTWASLGVRAMVMDNEPSTKALLACAAMVFVGVALGPVIWVMAASKRAKAPPAAAAVRAEMRAPNVLLGVMLIGMGASPLTDPSTRWWGWAIMIAASLVGGLNLGVAFMSIADQTATSKTLRQSTVGP